jgi:transcription initiation factor TFIIB
MEDIWKNFAKDTPEIVDEIPDNLCKECDFLMKLTEDGFLVCSNPKCGVLSLNAIDISPEWRFYEESSSNPTRCGLPVNPLLPKSSLGCKIMCSGNSSYEMIKLSRYNEWQSMPYNEKSQYDAFQYITIMASNSGIPKMLVEEACNYHHQISSHQTFRGLNRDGIIAASIYIACRIENFPRTATEIARMFHLDKTCATKGCKNAMTIINQIEQTKMNKSQIQYTNTTPTSFIARFCSILNMSIHFTKLANFIAKQIEKNELIQENTPHAVAAGIIFFISYEFELNITKKNIQDISDTSEVTINKCFKKIESMKSLLIPPSFMAAK